MEKIYSIHGDNMEKRSVDIRCPVYDSTLTKAFFNLKDKERDFILYWLNKITGLNYNVCRSDEERNTSPMLLCLGDVVVINQEWGQ